jgi:Arc/MetJ-type ribon-helix-helix transcriptional regulator
MPTANEGFRGVSLKADLVDEIQRFIEEIPTYRSIAEFVSESVRLRMEELRKEKRLEEGRPV